MSWQVLPLGRRHADADEILDSGGYAIDAKGEKTTKLNTLMVHPRSWSSTKPVWDENSGRVERLRIHEGEAAMEYPVQYTAAGADGVEIDQEKRWRMLGNSFHVGTVSALLAQGLHCRCRRTVMNNDEGAGKEER